VPEVTAGRILGHEAVGTVHRGGLNGEHTTGRPPCPGLRHYGLRRSPVLPEGTQRAAPRATAGGSSATRTMWC
jgi:hypothetical protein